MSRKTHPNTKLNILDITVEQSHVKCNEYIKKIDFIYIEKINKREKNLNILNQTRWKLKKCMGHECVSQLRDIIPYSSQICILMKTKQTTFKVAMANTNMLFCMRALFVLID